MKWGTKELSDLSNDELENVVNQLDLIRQNFEARRKKASEEKLKTMPSGPSENFLNLVKEVQQEILKRSVSVRSTEQK